MQLLRGRKDVRQWVRSQQHIVVEKLEFSHFVVETPVDRDGLLAGGL
jgi:hypothetical protein